MLAHLPSRARRAGAVLTAALLLAAGATPFADDALGKAVQAVSGVFRSGEVSDLRGVLPGEGKIFVAMPLLDMPRGYFSSGQFRALLAEAFRRHPQRELVAGEAESSGERAQVRAVLRLAGGKSASLALTFRREGRWVLRELRQQAGG